MQAETSFDDPVGPGRHGSHSAVRTPESSLESGLRLLSTFVEHGPTLGVSEVARLTGTAKTTAYRRLVGLERAGFILRDGQRYRLSWLLFELGSRSTPSWPRGLRDAVSPWLTYLHLRCRGAVAHIAVLDKGDLLYLDRVSSPASPDVPSAAGMRRSPTSTGLGKALLAFTPIQAVSEVVRSEPASRASETTTARSALTRQLRLARRTGVAIDDGETERGLYCIASPVVRSGEAVCAISVAGSRRDLDGHGFEGLVGRVAQRIAADLSVGARPAPTAREQRPVP